MKIAVGCDHRAIEYKEIVKRIVRERGDEVLDFGTDSSESADYPDYALPVARAVAEGEADRGVLVCSTGIGMSIAANKVKGVRAACVHDERTSRLSRRHNDANVLCLGATVVDEQDLENIVGVWLQEAFEGGRHERRVRKIMEAEA